MNDQNEKVFPKSNEFFISVPLYEIYTIADKEHAVQAWNLEYFDATIDAYCVECGMHSIFAREKIEKDYSWRDSTYNHFFRVELYCTRNTKHRLNFFFKIQDRKIQKIGQDPSIADLNLFDIKKYSVVLGKERFREFTRSIGLAAHGVGVGSFVYLRRIFESLISEAHVAAQKDAAWDEAKFQQSRMVEKIDLLGSHLPEFLVQNRQLYGILSKGIHELQEDECLNAFPVVKLGIEIILDAKLEDLRRRLKIKEAEKAIQALGSSLSPTPPPKNSS